MNHADLEATYELMAIHIDRFDEAIAPVYLAKLALLMAAKIDVMDELRKCSIVTVNELENRSAPTGSIQN